MTYKVFDILYEKTPHMSRAKGEFLLRFYYINSLKGHFSSCTPLKRIKEFVKIAGIPDLEEYFQKVREKGHRLWRYFATRYQKTKRVEPRKKLIKTYEEQD